MKRGDIVLVVASGDYGKPRPAVIIQSDMFNVKQDSIIVCPFTTDLKDSPLLRLTVHPSKNNGLLEISQIMAEKITALRLDRVRGRIGALDDENMLALGRLLAVILNIAGG